MKKIECDICQNEFPEKEISKPETGSPYDDMNVCQECLHDLLYLKKEMPEGFLRKTKLLK